MDIYREKLTTVDLVEKIISLKNSYKNSRLIIEQSPISIPLIERL